MVQWNTLRMDDFTGGLNDNADAFHLAPNELADVYNMDIDANGGISMRRGAYKYAGDIDLGSGNPQAQIVSMMSWVTSAGTRQLLCGARYAGALGTAEVILKLNDGGSFGSAITTSNTNEDFIRDCNMAVWDGTTSYVYVTRGEVVTKRWSGTASTDMTANSPTWQETLGTGSGYFPQARHVASHVDRMWCAHTLENGTSYPNRVRFSHPGLAEAWRSADYIDIIGGSAGITALFPDGDRLLVFKQDSIHAIYGYDTDTFSVVKLAEGIGAIHSRMVAPDRLGSFYFYCSQQDAVLKLSRDGITDISERIRQGCRQVTVPSNTYLSWAGGRLWFAFTGTTPGTDFGFGSTYVYDPRVGVNGAWVRHHYVPGAVLAATDYQPSLSGDSLIVAGFSGSSTEATLHLLDYQDDKFTDDAITDGADTNYDSWFRTKWEFLDEVSRKKMWGRCDVVTGNVAADTDITVDFYRDWDSRNVHRTGTVTIPEDVDHTYDEDDRNNELVRTARIGLARAVQTKMSGPGGQAWNVESITFKFKPRQVR